MPDQRSQDKDILLKQAFITLKPWFDQNEQPNYAEGVIVVLTLITLIFYYICFG
jgi:hypothetical protein